MGIPEQRLSKPKEHYPKDMILTYEGKPVSSDIVNKFMTYTADTSIYVSPYESPSVSIDTDLNGLRRMVEDMMEAIKSGPAYKHECMSCGGTVEWDVNKGIFICPYCGSHYAMNTTRINSETW